MKKLLTLLGITLAIPGLAPAADPATWLGAADCRIAPLKPEPKRAEVRWSGKCSGGYAEGSGVLKWTTTDDLDFKIEATLARGQIVGEGTLTSAAATYIGTFKDGIPHGAGYFKYLGGRGGLYEGGVADGKPDGKGISMEPEGTEYEGEWKAGLRHGYGRAKFALGGSYEGAWERGCFENMGIIVYAGAGHRYEGRFRCGRAITSKPGEIAKGETYELNDGWGLKQPYSQVTSNLPLDASWSDLTPAQQTWFKAHYRTLEDGDVPPYPVKGLRSILELVARANDQLESEGELTMHVLVGTDGRAKSVKTIGRPNKMFNRIATGAAMKQSFTPAICRGQPCEMIYPLRISLINND